MKTITTDKNILIKLPPIPLVLFLGENIAHTNVKAVYEKAEKVGWSKDEIAKMTDNLDIYLPKLGEKAAFGKIRKKHGPYFISPASSTG